MVSASGRLVCDTERCQVPHGAQAHFQANWEWVDGLVLFGGNEGVEEGTNKGEVLANKLKTFQIRF